MEDIQELAFLYNTHEDLTNAITVQKREDSMTSPDPPLQDTRTQLKPFDVYIPGNQESHCPDWLRDACRYRHCFSRCAITYDTLIDGVMVTKHFSFLFASQSPHYSMFLELEPIARVVPCNLEGDGLQEWRQQNWSHNFKVLGTYASDKDFPAELPANIAVLPTCVFRADKVHSNANAIPWATWVEWLHQGEPIRAGRAHREHQTHEESDEESEG